MIQKAASVIPITSAFGLILIVVLMVLLSSKFRGAPESVLTGTTRNIFGTVAAAAAAGLCFVVLLQFMSGMFGVHSYTMIRMQIPMIWKYPHAARITRLGYFVFNLIRIASGVLALFLEVKMLINMLTKQKKPDGGSIAAAASAALLTPLVQFAYILIFG